jgi:hypothetical protein
MLGRHDFIRALLPAEIFIDEIEQIFTSTK